MVQFNIGYNISFGSSRSQTSPHNEFLMEEVEVKSLLTALVIASQSKYPLDLRANIDWHIIINRYLFEPKI